MISHQLILGFPLKTQNFPILPLGFHLIECCDYKEQTQYNRYNFYNVVTNSLTSPCISGGVQQWSQERPLQMSFKILDLSLHLSTGLFFDKEFIYFTIDNIIPMDLKLITCVHRRQLFHTSFALGKTCPFVCCCDKLKSL